MQEDRPKTDQKNIAHIWGLEVTLPTPCLNLNNIFLFHSVFQLCYNKDGGLIRQHSSKATFYPCTVFRLPHPRGCTQLPLARCRLHCILQNGRGNGRKPSCLRFVLSSRSSRLVDCARKIRQLWDLIKLIIYSLFIIKPAATANSAMQTRSSSIP